jgi:hypothetical protein
VIISAIYRGADKLHKKLDTWEKKKHTAMFKGMQAACLVLLKEVRIVVSGGLRLPIIMGATAFSSESLHVRTGALRAGYDYGVEQSGHDVTGRVGAARPIYARIQELGGVILPRGPRGLLVFPIGERLIFAHVVRIPARGPLKAAGAAKKEELLRRFEVETLAVLPGGTFERRYVGGGWK